MKIYIWFFILILAGSCFDLSAQNSAKEPVDYVDPLMGTSFPQWTLFPGVTTPSGMVKISPDNQLNGWKAGYDYKTENIAGFSHIHSRTMGGLLVMPTTGELKIVPGSPENPEAGYRSRISHNNEIASPGYYSVILDDYKIKAELTSTARTAFQKYTYPKSDSARILIDLNIPTDNGYEILEAGITRVSNTEIEGFSVQQSLLGAEYNKYTLHFVMRFSKPFDSFNGWIGNEIKRNTKEVHILFDNEDLGVFLDFRTGEGEEILVQSGISLVSIDQARLNLNTELNPFKWSFDSVKEKCRREWNDLLQSIIVKGGSEADLKKFYTNMYRAFAGQTVWSDVNGKYVDMYEKIQTLSDPGSPVYGCNSSGPAALGVNQLWALCQPDLTNKHVKSLLEIYDKGGWFPENSEGIEYSEKPGSSYEIALMAGAYQQGIRGYDTSKMYKAILHDQTNPGKPHAGGGFAGKKYLESYLKSGAVPEAEGPPAITYEYACEDWSVAQLAKSFGNVSDFKTFTKRAFNYKNVFNRDTELMTAFIPHDVQGMINLSGRDEFTERLGKEIERSLESVNLASPDGSTIKRKLYSDDYFGGQTPLQAAYLFNYCGSPWLTQKWVREIMSGYFPGYTDPVSGTVDPALTGAWYVMSAIGLFQTDGGTSVNPFYELGSPVFEKIIIQLDKKYYPGGEFIIEAKNTSAENRYIQKALLDGKPLDNPWFYQSDLADGGTLVLKMGPKPNYKWGSGTYNAPPSMSSQLTKEETEEIMKYDKYAEDLAAWNQALRAYYYHKKEHFESLPNTEHEIIFLGNSITDNCEWSELFSNPNIKNRGIGGDDTDGILERLNEVTESNPSKIFIMIGTNDLSNGKTVEYIIDNYKKIIARIKQSTPGTKIYIQSVIPTDDAIHYTRRNTDIIKINDKLREIAAQNKLTYIDLFTLFKLGNNKINPEYSLDGLHLNGKGYLVWKDAILKYVEE